MWRCWVVSFLDERPPGLTCYSARAPDMRAEPPRLGRPGPGQGRRRRTRSPIRRPPPGVTGAPRWSGPQRVSLADEERIAPATRSTSTAHAGCPKPTGDSPTARPAGVVTTGPGRSSSEMRPARELAPTRRPPPGKREAEPPKAARPNPGNTALVANTLLLAVRRRRASVLDKRRPVPIKALNVGACSETRAHAVRPGAIVRTYVTNDALTVGWRIRSRKRKSGRARRPAGERASTPPGPSGPGRGGSGRRRRVDMGIDGADGMDTPVLAEASLAILLARLTEVGRAH
jgi:hypothetical protein